MTCLDRLRSRASGDPGFSLPELLVVMSVSGILLLALGTLFGSSLRTSADARARSTLTADTRLALDTVARRLRVAVRPAGQAAVLASAGPRSLTVYTSLAPSGAGGVPPPTKVEYDVVGDCLRERRTAGSQTATTPPVVQWVAPPVETCLARGVVNGDGSALFTYYASAVGSSPLGLSPTGLLSDVARDQVHSIDVSLLLADTAGTAPRGTRAQTRVTLVNRLNETLTGSG